MMVGATNFSACSSDDENKQSENYANATIYGNVINSATGEAIPTATIELYRMIMSQYLVATTITGTDGFFSFQNIKLEYEQTHIITVSHPDYQSYSHTVKLKPGSKLEINVSMQPKSSK
ncbi:MAG: carboxypeptidase-like regulatory domain-containing protein [Lachnospiraceae bacterium]|nr:carboxypeptidase-like regulatory domain-containing protein [Lachnospiraceae bacterium]